MSGGLLSMAQAGERLYPGRARPLAIRAVRRLMTHGIGVRGTGGARVLKLAPTRLPGGTFVTIEELQRFIGEFQRWSDDGAGMGRGRPKAVSPRRRGDTGQRKALKLVGGGSGGARVPAYRLGVEGGGGGGVVDVVG